jgi:hypothetical protein
LTTIALIRLAFVFICVMGFSSAFRRIDTGDVRAAMDSFDKERVVFNSMLADAPSPQPGISPYSPSPCYIRPGTDLGIPPGYPDRFSDQQRAAYESLQQQFQTLVSKCNEAYSPKITPMGVELQIDLRGWIMSFPFLLILSELYLQLVQKKRRLLRQVAVQLLHSTDQHTIDDMIFAPGRHYSVFLSIPFQLLEYRYALLAAVLVAKFLTDSGPYWGGFSIDSGWNMFLATAFFGYYAFLVYRLLARQMEEEAAIWITIPQVDGWFDRLGKRFSLWRRIVADRVRGTSGKVSGSVLILSSLFLATSTKACYEPHRGYELFLLHNRASWPTSWVSLGFHNTVLHFLD